MMSLHDCARQKVAMVIRIITDKTLKPGLKGSMMFRVSKRTFWVFQPFIHSFIRWLAGVVEIC